jgi:enoyl-[acyl-carrier-protein] reductase (NADH)
MTSKALKNIVAKTGRPLNEALETVTNLNPQKRLITVDEVVAVALLLASNEGRGINGQAINVDGGMVLS